MGRGLLMEVRSSLNKKGSNETEAYLRRLGGVALAAWTIVGIIERYGLMELWEKQQFILCCDPFILTPPVRP